jgi:hypothetical protein
MPVEDAFRISLNQVRMKKKSVWRLNNRALILGANITYYTKSYRYE